MKPEEIIKELRRPFFPNDVQYKIQTVGQKACLCVAYIDARHVQERLNNVCAGRWSNSFREVYNLDPETGKDKIVAVEATVSVIFWVEQTKDPYTIEHADVGSFDNVNENHHGLKAVYSDALKRAAVHWGIGTPLYSHPTSFLPKGAEFCRMKEDKPVGINDKGQEKLRATYRDWLEKEGKEVFGEPM
jgi:hypothetical protein